MACFAIEDYTHKIFDTRPIIKGNCVIAGIRKIYGNNVREVNSDEKPNVVAYKVEVKNGKYIRVGNKKYYIVNQEEK